MFQLRMVYLFDSKQAYSILKCNVKLKIKNVLSYYTLSKLAHDTVLKYRVYWKIIETEAFKSRKFGAMIYGLNSLSVNP